MQECNQDADHAVELWLIDLAYFSSVKSFPEWFEKDPRRNTPFHFTKLEDGWAPAYALFL